MHRVEVRGYEPLDTKGCTSDKEDNAEGDNLTGACEDGVAEAGGAMEGGEVFGEEDEEAAMSEASGSMSDVDLAVASLQPSVQPSFTLCLTSSERSTTGSRTLSLRGSR